MSKYTRENIKEGIINKINSIDNVSEATKRVWRERFLEYPIEIEQNILEWINDEPITQVDCYGESIRWVMDAFELDISWFPMILENFIRFKDTGFKLNSVITYRLC